MCSHCYGCNEFAGALTLASILLYSKTLGGGAIFSGWVPFNSSFIQRITPEAKKVKADTLLVSVFSPSFNSYLNFVALTSHESFFYKSVRKLIQNIDDQ